MQCETLIQKLEEHAAKAPEKTALAFRKESLTYGQLCERIRQTAAYLKELGVSRGDRVLFTAVSKPEAFVLYLGIQYAGAVAVFTDKSGTAENAFAVYEDSEAVLFLTTLKLKEIPEGIRVMAQKDFFAHAAEMTVYPEYTVPDEEEIAEILFTTGTTGRPKGVMLSYRAVINILKNTMRGVGITDQDVVLMPLPLHHSFALRVSRATLYAGGMIVLQNGFAFAKETEANLDNFGCTGIAAVPVSMELLRTQMQEHFYDIMSRFRFIEVGAGALTVEQRKRLSAHLKNVQITNTWGSSETGGVIFTYVHEVAGDEARVSTLGRPIDGTEIRVIGQDGAAAGDSKDNPGRLALKGGMVMSGYWNRPEQTKEALVDGWLVTNDLVWCDADGYVYMLGRSDDIINVGGEKLSPLEVENIASEYEGAGEYACVGITDPDGLLGQVPVLVVGEMRENYSADDLRKYLATRMERFKLPARILEMDALPRNRMQKLDRKAIAAFVAGELGEQ